MHEHIMLLCFSSEKNFISHGILAQLGEHLPYKQRVIGSSPIGPICAGVAELADAQDLKSCGTNLPYRFDSGRRHYSSKKNNAVFISK